MSATVLQLPGTAPEPRVVLPLNLTPAEVKDAAEGYSRPADQLRILHAKGFVRATRSKITGKVVLERGHYEAVIAGRFGAQTAPADPGKREPLPPNRAGYRQKFGPGKKGA